jgi:ABC-2 type transport system permease protein
MATTPSPPPSFSPRQKWSIALSVTLSTIAAFAILVGINYLSSRYFFKRIYLSKDTRVQLSSKTLSVLKSLTNDVNITVYYDKQEPLYADIMSLLEEYEAHSRKIHVKTIDYLWQPSAAAAFQARRLMSSNTNKDFIVFESNERWDSVPGNLLNQYRYDLQPMTNAEDSTMYVSQKRVKFNGEMRFTAKIFSLTQAKSLKAYFLQGHGERSPADIGDLGSSKLAEVFHRNYVDTRTLDNLFGTNSIPQDCSLLVIDGPRGEFQPIELDKISQYLEQGGRMFALFDQISASHDLGLEKALEKWNVRVGHGAVRDIKNAADETGDSFAVSALTLHDVMKPILDEKLILLAPRPIARIKAPLQSAADEPQVTELAFSSTNSVLTNSVDSAVGAPRPYPLMVAVEKSAPKGVVTDERGATRMLITGDAYFLDNQLIGYGANEDFSDSAVNWLLERTTFLQGIGPRPVSEYQLLLSPHQKNTLKGLLLGAIPGGILLFGGLVWLRRRK